LVAVAVERMSIEERFTPLRKRLQRQTAACMTAVADRSAIYGSGSVNG
jgi:hypothetical protein